MKIDSIKTIDYYVGSILIALLKPIVIFLEKLLKRDHSLTLKKEVYFVKLLGGGSLVIAFPALLGLRKKYPDLRFILITTRGVAPFAQTLNVFDEIIEVDYSSLLNLILTSLSAYFKALGSDTIIDLEVHSKLTTVFSVLTASRNRIGFYEHEAFWRRRIYTHMIYFNNYAGSYEFYDKIAKLFSALPAPINECREHLLKSLRRNASDILFEKRNIHRYRICIGHACSEHGRERMLNVKQWEQVFRSRIQPDLEAEVIFLGSQGDFEYASEIINNLIDRYKNIEFINSCGKYSLSESLLILSKSDEFWGVDSSLIHYARLLGIRSASWWGPTDPKTRLREIPELQEEIYYCKIPCSPCIHVTETAPCMGDNICIQNLFTEEKREWTGLVT